jgi:hypothetical protein
MVTFEDAYAAAFFASVFGTGRVSHFTGMFSHRRPTELAAQANLLRDLFGNPLCTLMPLDVSLLTWNAGLVRMLAQGAYDERLLPEGGTRPRSPGHPRGCPGRAGV